MHRIFVGRTIQISDCFFGVGASGDSTGTIGVVEVQPQHNTANTEALCMCTVLPVPCWFTVSELKIEAAVVSTVLPSIPCMYVCSCMLVAMACVYV